MADATTAATAAQQATAVLIPNASILKIISDYKITRTEAYLAEQRTVDELKSVLAKPDLLSAAKSALEQELAARQDKLKALDTDYSGNPIPIYFLAQTAVHSDILAVYVPKAVADKVSKDLDSLVSAVPASQFGTVVKLQETEKDNYKVIGYRADKPVKVAQLLSFNLPGDYDFYAELVKGKGPEQKANGKSFSFSGLFKPKDKK